jgi:hypothetical protein
MTIRFKKLRKLRRKLINQGHEDIVDYIEQYTELYNENTETKLERWRPAVFRKRQKARRINKSIRESFGVEK